MIFRVTMKDPDTLHDAIFDALDTDFAKNNVPEDERELLRDARYDKVRTTADQWFKYGEYLTVEIDTEKNTIEVVKDDK